jgi:protein AaeX
MKYAEVNIFGIYVAPFAVMMVGAWLVTIPLRHLGDRIGIARFVWHRALFDFAIYLIVLSLIVLGVGWR